MFRTSEKDDIELLRHLSFSDIDLVVDAEPELPIGPGCIASESMRRWAMNPALVSPATLIHEVNRVIPQFI